MESPFELWENQEAGVRFCISYATDELVTGALMIKSNFELSQYSYKDCSQSFTQLAGECRITTLEENGAIIAAYELGPGDLLSIPNGRQCIVTNIAEDESVTLFALNGDCEPVLENIRKKYVSIKQTAAQEA